MEEEIIEIADDEEYDEEMTTSDWVCVGFVILIACFFTAFFFAQIRKTFKNIHFKLGNKIEIGIDTKEDKNGNSGKN